MMITSDGGKAPNLMEEHENVLTTKSQFYENKLSDENNVLRYNTKSNHAEVLLDENVFQCIENFITYN